MPVTYKVDHDKKRIYTSAIGNVSYFDLRDHMLSEFGQPTAEYSELFDCTGATTNLDVEEIRLLVASRKQIAEIQSAAPVAIVAPTDYFYDLFRIFHLLTTGIRPIKVFRNVQDAEEWLDQKDFDDR
jgi:hypothetical protein